MNHMIRHICGHLRIPIFEPEIVEYENGVPLGSLDDSVHSLINPDGYAYCGFRSFPNYLESFDLSSYRKILLIRDPRDILVSHYFSQKFSHGIPPGQLGEKMQAMRNALASKSIGQYAIDLSKPLKNKFEKYESMVFDENLKLFRYEDVVFEKEKWLKEMLEFLGLAVPKELIAGVARQYDKRPTSEDPKQHVRKVTPGDHKEKLEPAVIEQLNEIFGEILNRYDYETTNANTSGDLRKVG
ncbi:MAG: sulfotransferase domain-containing protein [Planctomycetota bacterium]